MIKRQRGKAAIGGTAARPLQNAVLLASQCYHNRLPQSSRKLKNQLGELLLYLQRPLSQEQHKKCWLAFESLLRRYVEPKLCEV